MTRLLKRAENQEPALRQKGRGRWRLLLRVSAPLREIAGSLPYRDLMGAIGMLRSARPKAGRAPLSMTDALGSTTRFVLTFDPRSLGFARLDFEELAKPGFHTSRLEGGKQRQGFVGGGARLLPLAGGAICLG